MSSSVFKRGALSVAVCVALGVTAAHAQKLSVGVYKTEGAEASLLITSDQSCASNTPNAVVINGNKRTPGCWTLDGGQIKFAPTDTNQVVRPFDPALMSAFGSGNVASFMASSETPAASKARKTHLTCEADGWTMELDIERNDNGDLQRLLVAGDAVMANEKSTQITFSYDGLAFALNNVNASFTYETAGIQNYIRKNLFGSGKSKGTGNCRINELQKKF